MGSLQMRRRDLNSPTDMLPDYKRHNNANKPQKHFARNVVALCGVCLVVFLFLRASHITASLGISSPTRPKGPRGFTSAAGFEAEARHKAHIDQHGKEPDDASLIVDTSAAGHAGHDIKPAQHMDKSSLHGANAPHFVNGELVDPLDAQPAVPVVHPTQGQAAAALSKAHPHGVYSLSAVDIDGHERSLQEFAGKVTVIVNVASQCGYTDANYKGLQKLYEKYKGSGLEILAFPCNQFGHQEPGSDADVKHFATSHYHTTFPMFHKIDVNGASTHPVYQYLKEHLHIQDPPGLSWNFQKVLVNRAGKPVLLMQADWDQGRVEHAVYNLLVSTGVQ